MPRRRRCRSITHSSRSCHGHATVAAHSLPAATGGGLTNIPAITGERDANDTAFVQDTTARQHCRAGRPADDHQRGARRRNVSWREDGQYRGRPFDECRPDQGQDTRRPKRQQYDDAHQTRHHHRRGEPQLRSLVWDLCVSIRRFGAEPPFGGNRQRGWHPGTEFHQSEADAGLRHDVVQRQSDDYGAIQETSAAQPELYPRIHELHGSALGQRQGRRRI